MKTNKSDYIGSCLVPLVHNTGTVSILLLNLNITGIVSLTYTLANLY